MNILSNRKRKIQVNFRIDEEEKQQLDKRIQDAGIGRENFLRKSVLNNEIVIKDLKYFHELAVAVDKIGVNVNQIAKIANQSGFVTKDDIESVKKRVDRVWRLLKSGI